MRLALEQARRTLGNTKDNPAVGCVITRDNNVIGVGATSINGRPHAEINAIDSCKSDLKNSQMYVTIEPCSHYGETPPCVKTIIKRKINKIFFSIHDPDFRSFNKSSKLLKKKGISAYKGYLNVEVSDFYKSYINSKKNMLPFVTCKLATSKDFYTIDKKNRWITNFYSRGRVHLMRSYHDCIITSSNTVIDDNPRLTCRILGLKRRSPARIILDSRLRTPIYSRIIQEAKYYNTIIFYNKTNKKKIKLFKKLKIKIIKIPLDTKGNLDLIKSLKKVKELGFSRVFLESGIKLITNFLNKNLIDEFKLFISNKKLKKNGNGRIQKYLVSFLKNKRGKIEKVNLGGEKLITYKLK